MAARTSGALCGSADGTPTAGVIAAERLQTIDAIRGFAVCGILIMNIVSMGMPAYAYVDPHYYGGASGVDLFAWAAAYIVADGKMRALFTMLFGASMAMIADRAEDRTPGPVTIHYRRMAWLFAIGMIHAWLFWYGDILVEYAIAGAFAFIAWRWPKGALVYAISVLFLATVVQDLMSWHDLSALKAAASAPHASAMVKADWGEVLAFATPAPARLAHEITLYRGSFADAFAARMPMTMFFQSELLPSALSDTLAFLLLGLWLYRTGFLGGTAPAWVYRMFVGIGFVIVLPSYGVVTGLILSHRFDPAFLPLADLLSLLLRPWLALAYASAMIMLIRANRLQPLIVRLAAAGRMALSNYLGTTIIATTLFYGYGFGLYGQLGRAELYIAVVVMWGLILLWSKPWLDRFSYGPMEWLWRSLVRWQRQPMRRNF